LEPVKGSWSFGAGERKHPFHSSVTRRRLTARLSGSSIPTLTFLISLESLGSLGSVESTFPDFQDFLGFPDFMLIARVIGNVVATQKNQRYEGTRAMLCRQITPEGEDMEYTCIALDSVNSGEGDIVIIAQEGWSASGEFIDTTHTTMLGYAKRFDLALELTQRR